jgi:uncharacterized membrane protein YbhN (UPF0104 family)
MSPTPVLEQAAEFDLESSSSTHQTHRHHVRSPVDALRLIIGASLVAIGIGIANLLDSAFLGLSADGTTAMESFPDWVVDLPAAALAATILVAVAILALWTLSTRRFRRLLLFTTATALAVFLSAAVGQVIYSIIDDSVREAFRVDATGFRFARSANVIHPGDPLLAGLVAIIGVSNSYARRAVTRRLAVFAAIYVAVSLVATGVPAVGTVADIGVGILAASVVLLVAGRHDLAPDRDEITTALRSIGLDLHDLEHLAVDARASAPWTAVRPDGRRVFIKALGRDERSADLMFRAYRWLRLRKTGDHRPFVSLQRSVEHEALVSLQAAALGIRTPRILGVANAGIDGMVLAYEAIEGSSADTHDDITDETLEDIWSMVQRLHENRIAHRDLRLANIFIDVDGQPWLIDFGFSELAASEQLIGTDAAELLTSTAAVVGARRAVAAAHRSTGHGELERAMRWLQPLALSSATRQAIGGPKGIAPIRELLINECGIQEEPPLKLERVDRKTLFIFATLGLSAWFLIPQLADVDQIWKEVRDGSPGWALAAVAFSLLTYIFATGALLGAIPVRLRFGPALAAQLASSFANRVTPAKVGGVATNVRYFQRKGVPTAVAGTAIGLNAIAGLIMHVTLIVLFLLLSSTEGGVELPLPSPSTVGLAAAILAMVITVAIGLPGTRRGMVKHVIPQLRTGLLSLNAIARSPTRLILLFGGSASITLAYLLAMIASLKAFGSDASLPLVALLFLAGSAVATAAPTPGGLGAAEAALIAALSTVEDASIVVPAVFLYRLVTFWLPILPGWLALTMLRRTDHL